MKSRLFLLTSALSIGLTACGEKNDLASSDTVDESIDPRLAAVFVTEEPSGALSVIAAREQARPDTQITVVGRVAGLMEPFSKDFAILVLADDTVMTCERNPGDACETPWDACCVDPKVLAASRLSVQITGENGQPLAGTLKGVNGLKELDRLIISGTVAPGSSPDNLIIDATRIVRAPL